MYKTLTLYLSLFTNIINACNVLTLSGGGVFASFEMGLLSNIFENNHPTYDIVTGVSAGSLNAAFISSITPGNEYNYVHEFKDLWLNIKDKDVYSNVFFLNGISLYDNTPLKNKLISLYSEIKPIRPLKIGTTSLKDATTRVFDEKDVETYGFTDILLSSTAIPILFPPHKFLDDFFVDGGLTSNILLNEGVNFCLDKHPNEDIYVDVIICGMKVPRNDELKYNIKDIIQRLITVIQQQVEYSELLHLIGEKNIYITVYEQQHQESISLLDFSKSEQLWYEGYNLTNVNVYKKFYRKK